MHKKKKIILILILLFGILVRLYQIKEVFFITDEGFTLRNCPIPIVSLINYWFSVGHFPTYFIIMHYWMSVFGTTEVAMRFLSLIFGVSSIYVIFILGKRLFDENTGLLAAFILATNSLNIYYSQCARPYSMVEFFVLMSFLFLYDAVKKNTNICWGGYTFFTLFALLLSASTLPVIACHAVFIKILSSRYKKTIDIKKMILSFSLIFLVYMPFLLILGLLSFKDDKITPLYWISLPPFKSILDTFNFFGGTVYIDSSHMPTQDSLSMAVNIFGVILFLLCLKGIFSLFRSGEKEDYIKGIYLSMWLAGPVVLLFSFSQLVSPVFGPIRYLLYISPVYYLLISKGITSFRKKLPLVLTIFIIIFSFVFLWEYHGIIHHENTISPWRKLQFYLKKNSNIKNAAVLSFHNQAGLFDMLLNNVTSSLCSLDVPIQGVWSKELLKTAADEEMAKKIITGKGIPENKKKDVNNIIKLIGITELEDLDYNQFWFVDWDTEKNLQMVQLFKNKYDLIEEKSFNNVKVYWFRKR